MERGNSVNDSKIGSIMYFIERSNWSPYRYHIWWGIVREVYQTATVLEIYEPKRRITVDGVPLDEFPNYGEWKKLPKDWKRNIWANPEVKDEEFHYPDSIVSDEEYLLNCVECGSFVPVSTSNHFYAEIEVTYEGWRIAKKLDTSKSCARYRQFFPYSHFAGAKMSVGDYLFACYQTFDEADDALHEIIDEMERQANMTDEEWSKEQIEKTFTQAIRCGIPEEDVIRYRDHLYSQKNIENIETRFSCGHVEWKYVDKKRWITVT